MSENQYFAVERLKSDKDTWCIINLVSLKSLKKFKNDVGKILDTDIDHIMEMDVNEFLEKDITEWMEKKIF